MIYKGSCHRGKIELEVEGELTGAMACNCSICSRKGSLLWFVPRNKLRLLTPEQGVGTYTFNKHLIKHHFCQTCGMHPYAEGVDPKGNPMAAINIRCLEDIDIASVPVKNFDGRSLWMQQRLTRRSTGPRFMPSTWRASARRAGSLTR